MFDKIKQLSRETAIYGISTILGRFLNFLLVPFYTNVFAASDFGIYSNIYAYVAFLNIFYLYGMEAAFLKFSSVAETADKKDVFSVGFFTLIVTSILFSIGIAASTDSAGSLFGLAGNSYKIIYYVSAILFLDTLAAVPFASLRLKQKASKFAYIKIANIVVNLGLNLVLILQFNYGIEAIFISNLAASALSLLLLIPEIFAGLKFRFPPALLKKLLKFGLPYLPASLSAMMVQVIDKPILMKIAGAAETGIYQANYKLGIFMMLFVSMFQYAWQPFFLNNAKEENAKEIFSKVFTLFVIAGGTLVVFLSLFIGDAASLHIWDGRTIIGQEYLSGLFIVPIILFSYYFHGMYINFTAGIYIQEKTGYLPGVTFAGAVINIAANLLLIPTIGYLGAAIATFLSYLTMSSMLYFIAQRFYKIEYELKKAAAVTIFVVISLCLFYFASDGGYANIGTKVIIIALFISSLFFTKTITIAEVKTSLKLLNL